MFDSAFGAFGSWTLLGYAWLVVGFLRHLRWMKKKLLILHRLSELVILRLSILTIWRIAECTFLSLKKCSLNGLYIGGYISNIIIYESNLMLNAFETIIEHSFLILAFIRVELLVNLKFFIYHCFQRSQWFIDSTFFYILI